MKTVAGLKIAPHGEREIVMIREFAAPRSLVWKAMTTPELVQRWLLGPEGWTMPVCEIDLRVGGAIRYEWRKQNGPTMAMSGVFSEIKAPERMVATEVWDDPWFPGEATDITELSERDGITTVTLTVRYESREARDAVMRTPMADGMGAGYDRLEQLLDSLKGK
jgi:uncharacterized protein YndB with AHSA1/START domain